MYNKITKTIMIISFIGIIFGIWLISKDLKIPGFCPKLLIIPACYLVTIAFFLVYASSYLINKKTSNIGMGIGFSLIKKIIYTYKGNLYIEDNMKGDHTKGSNFIVELIAFNI